MAEHGLPNPDPNQHPPNKPPNPPSDPGKTEGAIDLDWMFRHPTKAECEALRERLDPEQNWRTILVKCAELSAWANRRRQIDVSSISKFINFRDRSEWTNASHRRCGNAYFSYFFLYHFYGDGIPDDPVVGIDLRHFPGFGEGEEYLRNVNRKHGFDFYSDCFFVQSSSAADSFCHVFNDLLDLGVDERSVSFNRDTFRKTLKQNLSGNDQDDLDDLISRRDDLVEFRNRILHRKPLDFCGGFGFEPVSPTTWVLNVEPQDYVRSVEIVSQVEDVVRFLRDWVSFVDRILRSRKE